ncbi:hypothetical protein L1887_05952 [Cichorium endivia]|nr:hypothetical protein L1887_05952 [Cichorium endivia]
MHTHISSFLIVFKSILEHSRFELQSVFCRCSYLMFNKFVDFHCTGASPRDPGHPDSVVSVLPHPYSATRHHCIIAG